MKVALAQIYNNTGSIANASTGTTPIKISRMRRIINVLVFVCAMLSNSLCIRASTASDSLPAPDFASSTDALSATLPSNPAGVIFRVNKIRRPHRLAEDFAISVPASTSSAFFFFSRPEKRRSHLRVLRPASASFCIRSISCFSIAFNIRRTRAILNMSSISQTITKSNKMANPVGGTSSQTCQPTGSKKTLRVSTTNGGIVNAMTSLVTKRPIPRIGSSRRAFSAHFVCGASLAMALRNGRRRNKILNNRGSQMITKT